MDPIFKAAVAAVRARYPDRVWNTLPVSQQTRLIYEEMRRLDLESRRAARQAEPAVCSGTDLG